MAWSNLNEKMCGRPNWFGCVFFSFHKLTLKLTTSGMWTEFSTRINFKIYSISICRERKKKIDIQIGNLFRKKNRFIKIPTNEMILTE